MADKNYTPEEEAYLRMLDREVPDLWSRIEAGLDREEAKERDESEKREERFLASLQTGNVASFEEHKPKKKKTRTWIIAGLAAAAAVLVISLAVIGFTQRETKDSVKSAGGSYGEKLKEMEGGQAAVESNEQFDASDEPAELNRDEAPAAEPSQDPDPKYSFDSSVETIIPSGNKLDFIEKNAEESIRTEHEAEKDSSKNTAGDSSQRSQGQVRLLQAKPGEETTLMELAKRMDATTEVRVYRMDQGKARAYRIIRFNRDDKVEILPEEILNDALTREIYFAEAVTLDGYLQVRADSNVVTGETVFLIQE